MSERERGLKKAVELLYEGRSRRAARFRYTLMFLDICTIAFLVVTTSLPRADWIFITDFVIGFFILCDLLARFWIEPNKLRMLRQIYTIADILVVVSLLLAPLITDQLAFLRVLRMLRLLHSYQVLRDLRRDNRIFRNNEEVIVSSVNLLVFILLVTALVFALQHGEHPGIEGYIDALYFTVTTLTTTGFGDIVLTGELGRLLSVAIMVIGVALFLRLAQSIFRPQKVEYTCPDCGLSRHEIDAICCKHCGLALNIEKEGEG